jgi:DNA polymerase I-like protein with 3'-5' exonuclease and polymerase domains
VTIHDAVYVETPEKEAHEARHLRRRMLAIAERLGVTLEVDLK